MPSTGVHGGSSSFKAIQGAHKFSLISCHRCKHDSMARSTNSKFDANVIGTSELHARAPGCFGPGDVSFNLGPTHGQELKFFLSKSNAISSSATLSLTSKSCRFGQGKIEITLASGVTQVVAGLVVDGVRATKGSYKGFNYRDMEAPSRGHWKTFMPEARIQEGQGETPAPPKA